MIRILKMIILGLVAAGLLVGCPKGGEDDAKADEPKEETKEEETKEEETKEEETKEEEETAEVDKEMYIKAAYEVTCVRAKVEDSETQKEILAEIYPRYGFTEESFTAAEGQLKDETTVQEAVKSKMEACTPEVAAAFKTAGADAEGGEKEEETKEEAKKDDKKKAAAKPAVKPGKYSGAVTGGGLEGAQIEVTVRDDMGIYAKVSGKREGKRFLIPMKGSLAKDGQFNLSGKKGQNSLTAKGRVGKGAAAGRLSGQINRKPISVTFNAK